MLQDRVESLHKQTEGGRYGDLFRRTLGALPGGKL